MPTQLLVGPYADSGMKSTVRGTCGIFAPHPTST